MENMENNVEKVEEKSVISKTEFSLYGDPGAVLTWTFTMLATIFYCIYAGIWEGDATLVAGATQLVCFLVYGYGALVLYMKGESLAATVFMVFAAAFGGIGGIINVIGFFSNHFGWGADLGPGAIVNLWAGLSLIPLMWVERKTTPGLGILVYFMAMSFLVLMALVSLGILPPATDVVIKWLLLATGVVGYYTGLATMFRYGGSKAFPMGKPWFK